MHKKFNNLNILIEASGSITSGYLIKSIKDSGNRVIGSDISEFNHAKLICDDFIIMPKYDDKDLWDKIETLEIKYKINIVIPSLDETLVGWSERVDFFKSKNIIVIISSLNTINTFQDKWKAYCFFKDIGILSPETSLNADFDLIKPRIGRRIWNILE